jgi:hypothetical protein
VSEIARAVPLLAVLTVTAEIGDHEHPARIEPERRPRTDEARRQADRVTAVAGERDRIVTVEDRPLTTNDVERYAGAIPGGRISPQRLRGADVKTARLAGSDPTLQPRTALIGKL